MNLFVWIRIARRLGFVRRKEGAAKGEGLGGAVEGVAPGEVCAIGGGGRVRLARGFAEVVEGEGVAAAGHGFPGEGLGEGFGETGLLAADLAGHADELEVEEGGFDLGEAIEVVLGVGDLADEFEFGGSSGAVVVKVPGEEVLPDGRVLVGGGDVVFGGEAEFTGVLGGDDFALGGFGAFGFCAIDAGGFDLGRDAGLFRLGAGVGGDADSRFHGEPVIAGGSGTIWAEK
jgi:hypothetical protein